MSEEDLLTKDDYRYTVNWPIHDQPVWLATDAGPLFGVTYLHETNDISMAVLHGDNVRDFADMTINNVAEMLLQQAKLPNTTLSVSNQKR